MAHVIVCAAYLRMAMSWHWHDIIIQSCTCLRNNTDNMLPFVRMAYVISARHGLISIGIDIAGFVTSRAITSPVAFGGVNSITLGSSATNG